MAAVEVQGHRGFGDLEPHNSLRAFRAAGAHPGMQSVEFDVRKSADGQLVVNHGPEVDNSKGDTATEKMTFEELRAQDLGQGERIPLFADVVDICVEAGMVMNVEIKTKETQTVDEVLAFLRSRGVLPGQFRISSFHRSALEHVIAVAPDVPIGAIYNPGTRPVDEADVSQGNFPSATPADFVSWFADHQVEGDSVNLRFDSVTPEEVTEARRHGKKVMAWYSCFLRAGLAEDEADYQRLTDLGVDVICINRPDLIPGMVSQPAQL